MKNRLVEKLMKENASLRGEMETLLSTVEETKGRLDTSQRDHSHKVIDMEHRVAQLENENKLLKVQLKKKTEEQGPANETRMQQFENNVDKFCQHAKMNMDAFNMKLLEQVQAYMEASKQQYDDFVTLVHQQAGEVKTKLNSEPIASTTNPLSVRRTSIGNSERRLHTIEVSSPNRSCLSKSMNSLYPASTSNSKTTANKMTAAKRTSATTSGSMTKLTEYGKIDEDPELVTERRKTITSQKNYQTADSARDSKSSRTSTLVKKEDSRGASKDLSMSKSAVVKGRASVGPITSDRKK